MTEPVGLSERFGCHDCGLGYGEPGWCDCHIPDDIWAQISPTGDGGGFLCITCIARRLVERGIDNVPLMVGSGPWDFDTVTERIRLEALEQGRRQGAETARLAAVPRDDGLAAAVEALASDLETGVDETGYGQGLKFAQHTGDGTSTEEPSDG